MGLGGRCPDPGGLGGCLGQLHPGAHQASAGGRVVQETRYVLQSYAPGESGSAQSGSVVEQAGESASPAHAASAGPPGAGPTGAGSALLSPGPAAMPQGRQWPCSSLWRQVSARLSRPQAKHHKMQPKPRHPWRRPRLGPSPSQSLLPTLQALQRLRAQRPLAKRVPALMRSRSCPQSPSLPQQPSIPVSKCWPACRARF